MALPRLIRSGGGLEFDGRAGRLVWCPLRGAPCRDDCAAFRVEAGEVACMAIGGAGGVTIGQLLTYGQDDAD